MTDKEAAEILIALPKKYALTEPEKKAIKAAVGILAWTSLSDSRLKRMKERRQKKAGI